ncbi:MAG: hypothetical protein ACF8NJ_10310 [Phycisphaerales bacterium JB038]
MRPSPTRRTLLTLAVAVLMSAGCTEQANPVAPPTDQTDGLVSSLVSRLHRPMRVVERTVPLIDTLTASARIGPAGGVIEIPAAGLRFEVPRGALRRPTTITVTAPAGDLVGYHFAPHGLNFDRPARVTQAMAGTELAGSLRLLRRAQGAYFTGALLPRIDPLELLDLDVILGLGGGDVAFDIDHFSGYVIAMN